MKHLNLKALSVNAAYRGRRFATDELEEYKEDLWLILPRLKLPPGRLSVTYFFGVSSTNADGDNLIKCFQDAVAEKYGFNDKIIYEWHVKKIDVPKGKEYIEFEIRAFEG